MGYFIKVVREAMSQPAFSRHFTDSPRPWYMPSVDEYTTLVKSSGLHKVHVWGENADRFFADAEAMIRWIDQPSIVPFLPYVPQEHRKEFRDYVVRRMIEEAGQSDGRGFETFR